MSMVTRVAAAWMVAVWGMAGCGDDAPPNLPPGAGATGGAASGMGATGGTAGAGAAGGGEAGTGVTGGAESGTGGLAGEADAGTTGGRAGASNGGRNSTGAVGGQGGRSGGGGKAGSDMSGSGEAGEGGEATTNGGAGGLGGGSVGGSAGAAGSGGTAGTAGVGPECVPGEMQVCEVIPGNRGGCFESVRLCDGETWGACLPMPGELTPGGEACNGEDEDCDGEIDEGLGEISCGLGACRNTVAACTKGVLGTCTPLEPQIFPDVCNGVDDDCDGALDEDCPDCVHVAPDGNDAAALASDGATPFLNVQPAIDFAAESLAPRVCVAAGATCGGSATFPGPVASALTMRDGVSLLAGYESTSWTHCDDSTTTLAPATGRGVYFPASIVSPTTLDGFTITSATATTTAAVTVEGGRSITLSNLSLQSFSPATNSYGVNITNGADVTIVRSRIEVGTGTAESIGVRAAGSRVQLEDNCTATDPTGRCGGECTIRAASQAIDVVGVALDDAPGSHVERSHVCAETVYNGTFEAPPTSARAVRIQGDGSGIVLRRNAIRAFPSVSYASAVKLTECGDAAPWLVDNTIRVLPLRGEGVQMAQGVSASGACHPAIDFNTITVGFYTGVGDFSEYSGGIHCGSAAGTGSRCVIAGNDIAGVGGGTLLPNEWHIAGIDCTGGACAKISRNVVVGRKHENDPWLTCQMSCNAEAVALNIRSAGPFVDRNRFSLGCMSTGVTVSMNDSWSRFQNNIATGKEGCPVGVYTRFHNERLLDVVAPRQELDIHSNSFWGGRAATCPVLTQSGVTWRGSTKAGIFRNNWGGLGRCSGVSFAEIDAASDPAVLENNALTGGMLYLDEGVTVMRWIADVNAMTDITSSGNIVSDEDAPAQWDRGTTSGAPLWDYYGIPRDETPSIGATER